MKTTLTLLVFFSMALSSKAQTSAGKPLEVFKTADDFFSNNKVTVATCTSQRGSKFKCEGKEVDVRAEGYFGYTWGTVTTRDKNLRVIIHPKNGSLVTFMGGCKDLLFYMPASVDVKGEFEENGEFIKGEMLYSGERPEFIKDLNFKDKILNLEKALAAKPEVVKDFQTERETVSANEWGKNRMYFYNKYTRQYCTAK
ncbi:MAG TPA: hypothetical protein VGD65_09435 [Chryseosolibacter sp.]